MLQQFECICKSGYKFDNVTQTCVKDSSVTPITIKATFFSKKEQKVTIQFSEKIVLPDPSQLSHIISEGLNATPFTPQSITILE